MKKLLFIIYFLTACSWIQSSAQKIIGGSEVEREKYPWMTALLLDNEIQCGAVLIKDKWVLTAGHCVEDIPLVIPPPEEVWINHHSTAAPNASAERIDIEKIFIHPEFQTANSGFDIALVRLTEPSSYLPISLANQDDLDLYQANQDVTVLGWGIIDQNFNFAEELQVAQIKIIDQDWCADNYANASNPTDITNKMMCAGYTESQEMIGAAVGDSGGPLFLNDNGTWKSLGIVSGGNGGWTTDKFPGIYVRTIAHLDWIEKTIKDYDDPLSVEDLELELKIHVDSNFDQIVIQTNIPQENVVVSLTDMMGRQLYFGHHEWRDQLSIDIPSNISLGSYMITIRTNELSYSKNIFLTD